MAGCFYQKLKNLSVIAVPVIIHASLNLPGGNLPGRLFYLKAFCQALQTFASLHLQLKVFNICAFITKTANIVPKIFAATSAGSFDKS